MGTPNFEAKLKYEAFVPSDLLFPAGRLKSLVIIILASTPSLLLNQITDSWTLIGMGILGNCSSS